MGIFDFLKKKPSNLTAEEKLDWLWTIWEKGRGQAPWAQLMKYESEVNNGGHSQYFFNLANQGKLDEAVEVILPVLPEVLRDNLNRGYQAFAAQEEIDDDCNEDLFDECDGVFYENEGLLIEVLKGYAQDVVK